MRWLVTGGAGFIGSHLVDRLLSDGHSVVVLDDYSTGHPRNLTNVIRAGQILRIIHDDVMRIEDLAFQGALNVDGGRPEAIVHLAAVVGVKRVMEDPVWTLRCNTEGTRRVLEVARVFKTPVFIASSSEVYGLTDKFPCREDQPLAIGNPYNVRWSYAASKLVDEAQAMAYHQSYNLPVTVGRFFNTVGPRQSASYGMVIPALVKQALAGEKLTIHGTGMQQRSFCHVHDTVDAIVRLMAKPAATGQIYNIGSPEECTIWWLGKKIHERAGHGPEIFDFVDPVSVYGPRFEDMPRRQPDISKIRCMIDWQPTKNILEIIDEVIAEQRE